MQIVKKILGGVLLTKRCGNHSLQDGLQQCRVSNNCFTHSARDRRISLSYMYVDEISGPVYSRIRLKIVQTVIKYLEEWF